LNLKVLVRSLWPPASSTAQRGSWARRAGIAESSIGGVPGSQRTPRGSASGVVSGAAIKEGWQALGRIEDPLGRLAQWESACLTRKRSLVQTQCRPPAVESWPRRLVA